MVTFLVAAWHGFCYAMKVAENFLWECIWYGFPFLFFVGITLARPEVDVYRAFSAEMDAYCTTFECDASVVVSNKIQVLIALTWAATADGRKRAAVRNMLWEETAFLSKKRWEGRFNRLVPYKRNRQPGTGRKKMNS